MSRPKSNTRIAYTGPYSDINFGDYAMLANNALDFSLESAHVFTYNENFVRGMMETHVPFVDLTYSDVHIDAERLRLANIPFMTPVELLGLALNLDDVVKVIDDIDVLVVNGGGYLNSLWLMKHRVERIVKILIPAIVASERGKRVVFMANGYGPFRGDLEFFASIFGTLRGAVFGVRDNITSPFWLRKLGVADRQLRFLPDDLLLMNDALLPSTATMENIIERVPGFPEGEYLIMETYHPIEYLEQIFPTVRKFIREIKREHGLDVVFVPFHPGGGGEEQGQFLKSGIPELILFDSGDKGYLNLRDAVALFKNAKFVISNRYHALILALSLRVPIASVLRDVLDDKQYYFQKNYGAILNVFQGISHRMENFLFPDYEGALKIVLERFSSIEKEQRSLYNQCYQANLANLQERRIQFIAEVLNHN